MAPHVVRAIIIYLCCQAQLTANDLHPSMYLFTDTADQCLRLGHLGGDSIEFPAECRYMLCLLALNLWADMAIRAAGSSG